MNGNHIRAAALRDQLLAVLRDAPVPVSTAWLAAAALPLREGHVVGECAGVHEYLRRNGYRLISCGVDGHHRAWMPASPQGIYPQLLRLEKLGYVERAQGPDFAERRAAAARFGVVPDRWPRTAFWRITAAGAPALHPVLAALEAAVDNRAQEI